MQALNSNQDAARKLMNTIITYNGGVYVCHPNMECDGTMRLTRLGNPNDVLTRVSYRDNGFQVVPYELGFMNNKKTLTCMYVARSASRHSDIGLVTTRLVCVWPGQNLGSVSDRVSATALHSEEFVDMLFNKYPSFDDALDLLSKTQTNNRGVAFSKNHAIVTRFDDEDEVQIYLYSGQTKVARLDKLTKKFITGSANKRFMLSMLAKSGVISHVNI
jgi:hypothetical protein